MRWVVMLVLVLIGPRVQAQGWRTALTVGADAALYVDMAQTVYGVQHGIPTGNPAWAGSLYPVRAPWNEANPLLGRQPTPATVVLYNGAMIAANTLAPRAVRPYLNGVTLLFEAFAIPRNARYVGLRVSF